MGMNDSGHMNGHKRGRVMSRSDTRPAGVEFVFVGD
jgi:hypothetical protein